MGFDGQKNWGRQEIFLVSGAVSRANNSSVWKSAKTFKIAQTRFAQTVSNF